MERDACKDCRKNIIKDLERDLGVMERMMGKEFYGFAMNCCEFLDEPSSPEDRVTCGNSKNQDEDKACHWWSCPLLNLEKYTKEMGSSCDKRADDLEEEDENEDHHSTHH